MEMAKVLSIKVVPADYEYRQHVKGRRTGTFFKNGSVHRYNGFGGVHVTTPTRIIITVAIGNDVTEIWVDKLFREALTRLTEKRINAICQTVPATINVERIESINGNYWYIMSDDSFDEWLSNTHLK